MIGWLAHLADPTNLAALMLDAAFGWPRWLYERIGHPVGLFARVVAAGEHSFNRRDSSDVARLLGGMCTVAILLALTFGASVALTLLLKRFAGNHDWIALAIFAWPALAQRSLDQHIAPVIDSLKMADLTKSRHAVSQIVGRDTTELDEAGIARAAIESLAESFCDGVIAPLFWLIIGGLPGIWTLKAINTADSLIGHREPPYRHFGWAAARLDDLMNFIPARISAVLICLAGCGGWRTCLRYCRCHASPNSGWPEAAMAGALRVRLAGPVSYDGALADKQWIGDGGVADVQSAERARKVYRRACLLAWVIVGTISWQG